MPAILDPYLLISGVSQTMVKVHTDRLADRVRILIWLKENGAGEYTIGPRFEDGKAIGSTYYFTDANTAFGFRIQFG